MSNFYCDKCGALCQDSGKGYVTGCEHYPAEYIEVNLPFETIDHKKVVKFVLNRGKGACDD